MPISSAINLQVAMNRQVASGNSLALVIEKPVLDLLNINENTQIKVSTDGKKLWLEPIKEMVSKVRSGEQEALATV